MKKTFIGLLVGLLANPVVAQAYCYTVTTDKVDGTALTATGEGSSGYVPHGSKRYLKNSGFSPSCKFITNSSSTALELYVPAYTQAEWASFLSRLPSGVTTADCTYQTTTTCTSSGSSSGGGGGGSDHYSQESHYNSDGTLTTTTISNRGTETRTTNNPINKSGGVQDYSSHPGGGSSSSSSRVICTYFMKKGMIPKDLWRADLTYTDMYISKATVRGYHFWGIPYVKLMRRSPLAERIMFPIALARAEEIGYHMGLRNKRSWRGVAVRVIMEPICFAIGHFVGEQDWRSVWRDDPVSV